MRHWIYRDKHGEHGRRGGRERERDGVLLDIQTETDEGEAVVAKLERNDEGQLVFTTRVDDEEKVHIIADGPIGKMIAKAVAKVELEEILDEEDLLDLDRAITSGERMAPRIRIMREMRKDGDGREIAAIVRDVREMRKDGDDREIATIVKDVREMRHHGGRDDDGFFNPEIIGLIVPLSFFLLAGFIVYFAVKSRRDQRLAIIAQGPEAIKHLAEEPKSQRDPRRQGLLYTFTSLGLVIAGVTDYLWDIHIAGYLVGGFLGAGIGLLIYDHSRRRGTDGGHGGGA